VLWSEWEAHPRVFLLSGRKRMAPSLHLCQIPGGKAKAPGIAGASGKSSDKFHKACGYGTVLLPMRWASRKGWRSVLRVFNKFREARGRRLHVIGLTKRGRRNRIAKIIREIGCGMRYAPEVKWKAKIGDIIAPDACPWVTLT
jgi:hypothetical protein